MHQMCHHCEIGSVADAVIMLAYNILTVTAAVSSDVQPVNTHDLLHAELYLGKSASIL